MELLQLNTRCCAVDLNLDSLERMYRPSARALSLVNNGRGGVQGEYRREKVEKVKLGWDSQLGLSRTRTKSIECGLTSSSSDDEEQDSPPVVKPRGTQK